MKKNCLRLALLLGSDANVFVLNCHSFNLSDLLDVKLIGLNMFKGRKMKCQSQLWSPSTFSVS